MNDEYLILDRKEVGIVKALNEVHKVSNFHPWMIAGSPEYYLSKSFIEDKDCPEDFKSFFLTLRETVIKKAKIELINWNEFDTHQDEILIRAAFDTYSSNQLPDMLYHYTDSSGLLGIITSKTLWATHYSFLNDYNEFEYAKSLIRDAVNKMLGESENDTAVKGNWHHFEDQFKYSDTFLVSFSTQKDMLSQWRGYSDHGKGYSLGFKTAAMGLGTPPLSRASTFSIRPVLYDIKEQKKYIKESIEMTQSSMNDSLGEYKNPNHYSMTFYKALHWNTLLPTVTYKSPHFQEEHEWRAIVIQSQLNSQNPVGLDVNFRTSNGQIIPFIELDVNSEVGDTKARFPLKEIIYGPSISPDIADKSLKMLARERLPSNVKIEGSNLTLRRM